MIPFLFCLLAADAANGKRDRFEPGRVDLLTAALARAVTPLLHPLQRGVDLPESHLRFRQEAEILLPFKRLAPLVPCADRIQKAPGSLLLRLAKPGLPQRIDEGKLSAPLGV